MWKAHKHGWRRWDRLPGRTGKDAGKGKEETMAEAGRKIRVRADGQEREYEAGVSLRKIAESFQDPNGPRILMVSQGNRLRELTGTLQEDADLTFLTIEDKIGRDTYSRSLVMLLVRAFERALPGEEKIQIGVHFAVSGGLFCTLRGEKVRLTEDLLGQAKDQMKALVAKKVPFEKKSVKTWEAVRTFTEGGMEDKAKLFRYRISSRTNLYTFDGYTDYNYGYMVPDSSYLDQFDLRPYQDGFVLLMPGKGTGGQVPPFAPVAKLFSVQNRSRLWGEAMGIDTVGDLNGRITEDRCKELILAQEAAQEKEIAELADRIASDPARRLVLIAGPSSSSKTTFSHRLSIQLSVHGLVPHPIPMDDYFKNREDTPRDEKGNYDFECLEAIDVDLFQKDMGRLLAGQRVDLPTFNFRTGRREYKGRSLQLSQRDILVIEGIHGIDPALTSLLPAGSAFRIYISALTQLNIDEHNRIPTTDGRLIRRIVRDQRTRGTSAKDTIAMWNSVRRGEERYIFPYQESADAMFNSALIYELAVLKIYAQPMLFAVPADSSEYTEAKRLLKFLDYFLPIPADHIPKNSLLREFIGGGTFTD